MAPEATHPDGTSHSSYRRDIAFSHCLRALTVLVGCVAAVSVLIMAPAASAAGGYTPDRQSVPRARADDGAHVSAVRRLNRHITDLTITSPAMHAKMPVRMILPRSWSRAAHRTFPTLYLLQGAGDNYTSWARETDIEKLASRANVIVVMPEGGRAGFYTNWWNRGRKGGPNWETFHTVELPQILGRGYRANSRRAVIGLSEGGLGALNYAARHRGEYVFAGSFSGIVNTADKGTRVTIFLTCLREGADPIRLWGDPVRDRKRWDAHNPAHRVSRFRGVKVYLSAAAGMPERKDAARNLEMLRQFSRASRAGQASQIGRLVRSKAFAASVLEVPGYVPTAKFAQELRKAGVDVTAHLYLAGTHSWPYWQRELHRAWPSVLAALRAAR